MKTHDGISKLTEVLDVRIAALESRLAAGVRLKHELRSRQVAITSQAQELAATLQERSTVSPTSFAFEELRLQKSAVDQQRLQPVLAKAAIQRRGVQDQLRSALRQRLALRMYCERKAEDLAKPQSGASQSQILFELKQRV